MDCFIQQAVGVEVCLYCTETPAPMSSVGENVLCTVSPASAGGNYPAKSLSTVFMGIYIRFGVSGKERNPYLE